MDRTEIRMRCLETAQLATKSPAMARPDTIVEWARAFEAFVVGPDPQRSPPEARLTKPRAPVAPQTEGPNAA